MSNIRNFAEAHEALRQFYGSTGTERRYKLDRMRALMAHVGNPQESLKVVHVAGTSGKTSTCYYAAALLKAMGTKVGLTVSPHVDEVNERVQINLVPLPEAEFCRSLGEFIDLVQTADIRPSYFELMVAFAFWEFARQKVDYAVVEVGLGGLLDGTNVVERSDKVCVITDIGLDHTEVLGDTLAQIAAQKAGIIQAQNHVFMYSQGEEVMQPVRIRAREKQATLHEITPQKPHSDSDLPLFQQRNLYLAQQTVEFVAQRDGLGELIAAQQQTAAHMRIPARMERFQVGDKTVVIDGSHNAQKLGVLAESLRAAFPNKSIAVLVSFVQYKDERWQRGLDELFSIADSIIVTAYAADQDTPKTSVDPHAIAEYCQTHAVAAVVEPDPKAAFEKLLQQPEMVLLVAGSFYLLNHIRPFVRERSN